MARLISRRKFLKMSGGVVGGVAVSELIAAGVDVSGVMAAAMAQTVKRGQEVPGVCPSCAIGCGQIITVSGGKVIDIQGNPDSPIHEGTLCPNGAANYQLAVNSNRWDECQILLS